MLVSSASGASGFPRFSPHRRRANGADLGGGGARGFSLIELMIVVAIVGIMAMIAGPSFIEISAQSQVKTVASDLQATMMRARSEAIKRSAAITITPTNGNWAEGWSIANGIDTHGAVNVAINGPASITYNGNGRVSTGARVQLDISSSNTTLTRCVTVELSGQPVIKQAACT